MGFIHKRGFRLLLITAIALMPTAAVMWGASEKDIWTTGGVSDIHVDGRKGTFSAIYVTKAPPQRSFGTAFSTMKTQFERVVLKRHPKVPPSLDIWRLYDFGASIQQAAMSYEVPPAIADSIDYPQGEETRGQSMWLAAVLSAVTYAENNHTPNLAAIGSPWQPGLDMSTLGTKILTAADSGINTVIVLDTEGTHLPEEYSGVRLVKVTDLYEAVRAACDLTGNVSDPCRQSINTES